MAGIQRETLQFICKKYTEVPELILANKQYVQCCMDDLGNFYLMITDNFVFILQLTLNMQFVAKISQSSVKIQ